MILVFFRSCSFFAAVWFNFRRSSTADVWFNFKLVSRNALISAIESFSFRFLINVSSQKHLNIRSMQFFYFTSFKFDQNASLFCVNSRTFLAHEMLEISFNAKILTFNMRNFLARFDQRFSVMSFVCWSFYWGSSFAVALVLPRFFFHRFPLFHSFVELLSNVHLKFFRKTVANLNDINL